MIGEIDEWEVEQAKKAAELEEARLKELKELQEKNSARHNQNKST